MPATKTAHANKFVISSFSRECKDFDRERNNCAKINNTKNISVLLLLPTGRLTRFPCQLSPTCFVQCVLTGSAPKYTALLASERVQNQTEEKSKRRECSDTGPFWTTQMAFATQRNKHKHVVNGELRTFKGLIRFRLQTKRLTFKAL
jgi:hypothetical protein